MGTFNGYGILRSGFEAGVQVDKSAESKEELEFGEVSEIPPV